MFANSPKHQPLSRENGDLVANGSSDPFTTPPRSESGQTSPSASSPSLSTPAQDPFQGGPLHLLRPLLRLSTIRPGSIASLRKPYPSTKLRGEIHKPWLKYPDPAQRWAKILFWALFGLGFAASAVICYFGYASVQQLGKVCLVMEDTFDNGINSDFWSHEVRLDGFGNNEFEWTTASSNNSFVKDGILYIVPTLTEDVLGAGAITNGYTLNLTTDGTCTSSNVSQCAVVSNSSTGAIINPVQSARLITRDKVSVKYGKVEVTARMPLGDWLWPAIWMLPQNSNYGAWPAGGEIDIAESRGNAATYPAGGIDKMQGGIHWGPLPQFDSWWRTFGIRQDRVKGYHSDFHKYTLEWDERYMTIYIDNRVYSTLDISFDKSFWSRGNFPTYFVNGTDTVKLANPWVQSASNAAPFDEPFYLILNVAVGGTNGFFPDNVGGKPWSDSSLTAMGDFWAAKDRWHNTWPADPTQRGMAVKSVRMWQKC
ncbi:hypothetical protein EHS25_002289 [Saitozyma podzolica]|uniref:GH16 domain-containing protein n=1 Tax=Saitozyma podzolica TaxID=1890683 RepID=A0A427YDX8_9TREE|nr:hypothetical protein EHS25_002289 [Saitozyma podzolica]